MNMLKTFTTALVIALATVVPTALAQDKSHGLAIVVNTACTMENVTSAELAKIFKAEKAMNPDGCKYVLAMRESGSPERMAALKSIYRMTDSEYEKFFLQATFAGTVQSAPKQIGSPSSVKQFISSNPGAICYMRASDTDSSVKVLKVDGKSPGDADYPLKIK